jgi:hypothetical protein
MPDQTAITALLELTLNIESSQREQIASVSACRDAGYSWEAIGGALGMTRQAAWQRFSGEEGDK